MSDGMVSLLTDAGFLWAQEDDRVITPALRHTGTWEPEEAQLLESLCRRNGGWFYDLGAHVGYHSCRLLSRGATDGVLAVEANPATYEILQANLQTYAVYGRVRSVNAAAWNRAEVLQIAQREDGNGGDYRVGAEAGVKVHGVPVDTLVEPAPEGRVGVIKSDLQGRDHLALQGLAATLDRDRPDVVCEFDPAMIRDAPGIWSPEEVLGWYEASGYRLRLVDGTVLALEVAVSTALLQPGAALTLWLEPEERAG